MTPTRKIGVGAFLLGSIAGGAIGSSGLASAAPTDDSTTATTVVVEDSSTTSDTTDDTNSDSGTETSTDRAPAGPHTANGITEEELTGDTAAHVEAAVLAAYPDATIDRMETDVEGAAYEAHVTLADGSRATIKVDESFAVTATETGPDGTGCGPGGRGPGGPDDADDSNDDVTADTSSTS